MNWKCQGSVFVIKLEDDCKTFTKPGENAVEAQNVTIGKINFKTHMRKHNSKDLTKYSTIFNRMSKLLG